MTKIRMLPNAIDAEASILGGVILRNQVLGALDTLETMDFYDHRHQVVWQAMRNLQARLSPIDLVTLESEVARAGKLEALGGMAFFAEIALRCPTPDNVEAYAQIVKEHSITRTAMLAMDELIEHAYDGDLGGDELVNAIGAAALSIRMTKEVAIETIGRVARAEAEKIEADLQAKRDGRLVFSGVPTGIATFDAKIGGAPEGVATFIGARPAAGKTTFAMALAKCMASVYDEDALLVSYEDGAPSFGQRALAQESGIDTQVLRARNVKDHEFTAMSRGIVSAAQRRELFMEGRGLTVEKLIGRVRREQLARSERGQKRIRCVIIDYIGRMPMPPMRDFPRKDLQIEHITSTLANWARDDKIAVLGFVQLKRDSEARDDKRPQLTDFKDSGSYEQDGKLIFGLHRPHAYDPKADPSELVLSLIKNAQGEAGVEIRLWVHLPTHSIFDSQDAYQRWVSNCTRPTSASTVVSSPAAARIAKRSRSKATSAIDDFYGNVPHPAEDER